MSISRLPRERITPIPNKEIPCVPSLWNTRYAEIDENFESIDARLRKLELFETVIRQKEVKREKKEKKKAGKK